MRVYLKETGEVTEIANVSYAIRLVEQGKAIPAKEEPKPAKKSRKKAVVTDVAETENT